jgi:thiol-disulfide isomerase/thioredoxin
MLSNTHGQKSHKFILNGNLSGRTTGTLYVVYWEQAQKIIDSAEIKNGKFVFSGFIHEPARCELVDNLKMLKEGYGNYLSEFYLEPGLMDVFLVENQFAQAKIRSKTNEDYQLLNQETGPLFRKISQLQNLIDSDKTNKNALEDSLAFYNGKAKETLLDFIRIHTSSYAAINAVQKLSWVGGMTADSTLMVFNSLNAHVKKMYAARKMKDQFVNEINSSNGHAASEFERTDINGKLVKLSSFRGKYVLLDFWASWCAPCRAQTPRMKSLYKEYHSKGLSVIAISCDGKYDAWREAIKEDSTEFFTHILSFTEKDMDFLKHHDNSNEASFEGELRKQFNLMPIPVYILIDPNGVIIGRYGATEKESIEMLHEKIGKIFGKV